MHYATKYDNVRMLNDIIPVMMLEKSQKEYGTHYLNAICCSKCNMYAQKLKIIKHVTYIETVTYILAT